MLQYINFLRVFATISVIFIHVGSLFISTLSLSNDAHGYIPYAFFHRFFSFAVPIFVLMSGALLLTPNKIISYKTLFNKYILRIVRTLFLFALPMALLEFVVDGGGDKSLIYTFAAFLCGHSWTHMWYLYMLVGLYAITPLFKVYIDNSTHLNVQILLCVLGGMCVVLPFINKHLIPIEGYITLPVFLFLFLCGYCANVYIKKSKCNLIICIIILCIYFIYILKNINVPNAFGSGDLFTVFASIAIFHLSKYIKINNTFYENISKHCFCIYIVHAFFLNVLFKVFHVEQYFILSPFFNVLIVSLITLFLSLFSSRCLRQIPWLRNNVL